MATRSTSITAPQTARLHWPGQASALFSVGWMPMQAVTAASERRICKATVPGFPQVSYLAQTQEFITVILYSPECVDGAADADSQLSIL
jgi:hypothetical protein